MRPDRDEIYLGMAGLIAKRSTCLRRNVGCVLINERGHILSLGYNGVAAGQDHCNEGIRNSEDTYNIGYPNACEGSKSPSGRDLDKCEAIHAEQNALLQCPSVFEIHTAYLTVSPCITCIKLFMNTGIQRIVFSSEYPQKGAQSLAKRAGISWEHYGSDS